MSEKGRRRSKVADEWHESKRREYGEDSSASIPALPTPSEALLVTITDQLLELRREQRETKKALDKLRARIMI